MDSLDDIYYDLQCIVKRAQKQVKRLQIKRLVNSDNSLCFIDYFRPEDEHNLEMYDKTSKCTLKDFQSYFKVLRQLSQYKYYGF